MLSHDHAEGSIESPHTIHRRRRTAAAPRSRARAALAAVLLGADVMLLIMTAEGVHGPLRMALGLLFALVIPGWSVVGLLRLDEPAMEAGLTMGTSLALLMVIAQLLISVRAWDLAGLEEVACIVCIPSLLWQALAAADQGLTA